MKRPRRAALCALIGAAAVMAGTQVAAAATPFDGRPVVARPGSGARADGCTESDAVVSCAYTGSAQTVTVPAGVTHGRVELAGASGGDNRTTNTGGAGSALFGELTVTPGAQLTIGVGGRGGNTASDSRPGDGGWGLDNRSGGRGGMARRGIDGGGGGGASVLKVDGREIAVAAGGGGASYQYPGGRGGATSGSRGSGTYLGSDIGGYGGSTSHPHNDRAGASPATVGDGGGGGGGGYYSGEGGGINKLSAGGGGGGGGGHWDTDRFRVTGDTTQRGSGFVRIFWDVTPSRPTLNLTTDGGQRQVSLPAHTDLPVTLTVTPSDVSGTVDVYTSNTTSGTRKLTTLELRNGTAGCTVPASTLAKGTNYVFATYDGSRSYLTATSNMLDVTVRS